MGFMDAVTTPADSEYLKVLIYGQPGTGKTVFAASAPDPLIIDIENGTTSLTQFSHLRTIPVLPYKTSKTMEQVLVEFSKEMPDSQQFQSLVIDSFSEFQKRVLDEQLQTNSGTARYIPDMAAFNLNTNMLRAITARLRALQKHVVITAHVKEETDQLNRVTYRPDLTPKLSNSLIGLMDVVGYMQLKQVKENNQEKTIRELTLVPTKSVIAKSRIGGTVLIDPTFDDLLNLQKGN